MNRRRFLKRAGVTTAVVGAGAFGLDALLRTTAQRKPSLNYTTTTMMDGQTTTLTAANTISPNFPSNPTRILASVGDFQRVWNYIQSYPLAHEMYSGVRANAEQILTEAPYRYESSGESGLLRISRRTVKRLYTLGLMYRLNGDHRYMDRVWAELRSAAQFPDWNPDEFLSTAEMSHAFAVGYDWFPWSGEQKQILRGAIVAKGLKPALESYQKNSQVWTDRDGWVTADHNWNQVCNGGIGVAALSIQHDLPDLSSQVISYARKSISLPMQRYAPDGAWIEGPVYWNYATFYNCIFLAALESTQTNDSALLEMPAFSDTGLFPIYLTGPTGRTFNFSDTESDLSLTSPQMFWLARKFNRSLYSWFAQSNGDFSCPDRCDGDFVCPGPCVGLPLGLLWFDPESKDPLSSALPLDKYFRTVEAATLRSAWNDSDALFVGIKAGNNDANHAHLDNGSFVLQALGQRWSIDLGADDYNLPSFGCRRCYYYRYRAEGHNTLVFNPSKNPDQNVEAYGKILRFESNTNRPYAIADLTPAYSDYATVQRGIALPDRKQVIVQDEIRPRHPVALWWFMHTPAKIESYGQTALLSQGKMRLWCAIISPQKAEFTVMDANPLPTSPNPAGQNPNYGVRKIAIHLPDTGPNPFTLAVAMVPLKPDGPIPTAPPPITPLANW